MGDPHKPLRDDVRLLGELLGRTLREIEGEALFETVEAVRMVAKEARAESAPVQELSERLRALPVVQAVPVARAFAHFLHLANVAEQHHRIRRRRDYMRAPDATPQRGSCEEAFPRLIASGVSAAALHDAVHAVDIELVLTAHPTEIARRTMVQKYNRIAGLLSALDRSDLTVPERHDLESALLREVMSAWGTDEVRSERPTPLDEVRTGLVLFEESLWEAVPKFLRGVDRALLAATGRPLSPLATPIRFGSWIGGDRDGNPNVTPDVTRRACLLSRWVAARLYLREVDALRDELSLAQGTSELAAAAGEAREPYRALLRGIRERLRGTIQWIEASLQADEDVAAGADLLLEETDFVAAVDLCARSLEATGFSALAGGRLLDVRRRLGTFGMTLVRLDIRQEAARHDEAVAAVLAQIGLGDYGQWNESERVRFFAREIQSPTLRRLRSVGTSPEVSDVLGTFQTLAKLPRNSLGAYVITMASRASDVLAVVWLQQLAGLANPLRVVPLFETSNDLQRAGEVLDELFSVPPYRERIDGRQEVMIGYSDSAKDVGRFAASWDLYEAQEQIVAVSRRHGVHTTLFHGRGGSVGRGGGPTHLAMMSQPAGSINGSIRVTEQGEMLQTLFGLPGIAGRTLDVYTTATLEAWLRPAAQPAPHWRAVMDDLRRDARAGFRSVVYEDARFIEYFRTSTPEAELGEMNIGSRPARRKASTGLQSLRAIPWQFAWTQTRLLLGAWLGIDEALESAIERGQGDTLRLMYREWPPFRSIIDLTEMVLAKADERIAAEYDRRLVAEELQPLGRELRTRLRRAGALLLEVTGHRELLEENPVLRRSIDVRNPYVDPINLLQIELLCRVRQQPDDQLRAALHLTINGIAAGMRNTG